MGIGRPNATASVGSLNGAIVTATKADMTLYVRSTGNDGNDGLTEGTALLTIQEAVDRIPRYIRHNVTIDIGEGNFAGFAFNGYTFNAGTTTLVKGILGNPTLTTGTTSGTADGGTNIQLIDSGQTWTAHELRGRLILVDGEYRVARDNDATTIDLVGTYAASVSGKAYEILEQKTVINSDGPNLGVPSRITVKTCTGIRDSLNLQDLKVSGSTAGIASWDTSGFSWTRIWSTGAYYGGLIQTTRGTSIIVDSYFESATACGLIAVEVQGQMRIYNLYVYGCGDVGFYVGGAVSISSPTQYLCADNNKTGIMAFTLNEFMPDAVLADGNLEAGLYLEDCNTVLIEKINLTNNSKDGLLAANSQIFLDSSSGPYVFSGNGGWGINIGPTNPDIAINGYFGIGGSLKAYSSSNLTIENNTLGGILAGNGTLVRLLGGCDGVNTGPYGLELQTGSYATITSATAITGASGDATIDGGITVLSWATDFPNDGDTVANIGNNCRIERKD